MAPVGSGGQQEDMGIFLTVHDEAESILKAVEQLGYELSEEDKSKVVEAFRKLTEEGKYPDGLWN